MTIEEIKENLCYYDRRNPSKPEEEWIVMEEKYKKKAGNKYRCYCDSCLYGRTPLAEELLKHLDK